MLRRSTLSHARPASLLLVLVALTLPIHSARSQDRAMQDRLERLERDLSMLQRQVYRGGGVPPFAAGHNASVDTELRMDRLEAEMRDLTGRVENAANGVEQLRRRLEQINSDVDVRFGQGQGPSATALPRSTGSTSGAGTLAPRAAAPTINQTASAQPSAPLPSGTPVPPPYTATGLGTLTPPGSLPRPAQAAVEPAGTPGAGAPSSGILPSGSASDQYNFAFGLLKQADYSAAEEALKGFIRQHPDDPLAGSAQYWIGETHYARGNYAEAATAFAEGYKRYPKGAKAADNLLKLGMSLARTNQKPEACVALAKLDHDFPNPGNTIKERVKDEKKKAGC
jgi:tol-pal system protein YbgF